MAGPAPSPKQYQDTALLGLPTAEPSVARERTAVPAGRSNSAGLGGSGTPPGLGNDVVKSGQRLTRIRETAAGRYRLTFERAGGTNDVVADFVVLAIPFAILDGVDTAGAGFNALKAILEAEKKHLEEIREDRDRWAAQAERLALPAPDVPHAQGQAHARRGLFGWINRA